METKRSPRRGARPLQAQLTEPIKQFQDNRREILPSAATIGKSTTRAKLSDQWIEKRITYLSAEVDRLDGGPIARLFLRKAKAHYRQYCRFDSARQRYLSWKYLNQAAVQLVGRPACPSEKEPGQRSDDRR
jgi:hypothetical protein